MWEEPLSQWEWSGMGGNVWVREDFLEKEACELSFEIGVEVI